MPRSFDRLAQFERRLAGGVKIKPRRPKKNVAFDLLRTYDEAVRRTDDWRLIDADQKVMMELLVDGHLHCTLQSFVKKTISEVGEYSRPSSDHTEFVRAMVNRFPTLASASEITALSNVLRAKGLESYYTEEEIAKYMCKAYINAMYSYGAYAKIEHGDVVSYMMQKFSREKALELVESIES